MPRGWPKGKPRGTRDHITHEVGSWSWNTNTLHRKIRVGDRDECWEWIGSKNKWGNLYGAYKNGHAQMTQANRIIQMEISGEPVEDISIIMTCKNIHCCNHNHFSFGPNYRKIDLV